MPTFDTTQGLLRFMKKDIENILRSEVSPRLVQLMQRAIHDKVYSARSANGYKRTYNLLSSVYSEVKNEEGSLNIDIYNNTDLMTYTYPSVMAEKNGQYDNRDMIVEWVNDGHGGIWHQDATNYIETARERIELSFSRILRESLAKHGIRVVL